MMYETTAELIALSSKYICKIMLRDINSINN